MQEAATGTTSKRDAMTDSSHMHVVCVIDLVRGKDSKNKDGGMESPVAALKVAYAEIEKACEWSVPYSHLIHVIVDDQIFRYDFTVKVPGAINVSVDLLIFSLITYWEILN